MWHLIPAILYLACVQGHHHHQPNNAYSAINNDHPKLVPYSYENYPGQTAVQAQYSHVPAKQYHDYTAVALPYNNPAQRQPPYIEDPYSNASPYKKMGMQGSKYYNMNDNNLRQYQSQRRPNFLEAGVFPLDYSNEHEPDVEAEPVPLLELPTYLDDLELIDNFGNYLKRRTRLDKSSTSLNDAAHQFNALLTVIIALARVVRNSCADFDQVYDQAYLSTVDTYYNYGLTNADKVAGMIEDYIRTGNSRMTKIQKLKQELCEKERSCSMSLDNQIKSSPLLYVKELETLEALSRLARSFSSYIKEFNQAAQQGTVLPYLQNNKDRLREYVMHVVNSSEHLTDKPVKCM